jgi:hypothetical protein
MVPLRFTVIVDDDGRVADENDLKAFDLTNL